MNKPKIQQQLQLLLNSSVLTWVLSGFLVSYLFFYIRPIFFASAGMQFLRYVPAADISGTDLQQMLAYSQSWVSKQTPYIGNNLYPPLASVLFAPLLFVEFAEAYKIISLVTLCFYVLITWILPLRINKEKQKTSLLVLLFITGLFSYGLHFELERGQFNVIATALCFLGIWIYHYHNKYRYLTYILFSLSVQLKIFPLIFMVMLIDNWQDWKNNAKRLLLLTMANFALFFALGPSIFIDFIQAIKIQTLDPYIWIGNHSIRSFAAKAHKLIGLRWIKEYSESLQLAMLALVVVCIFVVILQAYRQKYNGMNPYLLLACTLGALLVPSVSHDYTLSILASPVAILICSDMSGLSERATRSWQRLIFNGMIFLLSVTYSLTLFGYANKPPILQNNCPWLAAMLVITTCLSMISMPNLRESNENPGNHLTQPASAPR